MSFQHNSFEYDHLIAEVSLRFQYFIERAERHYKGKTGYDHIRLYTSKSHHQYRTEVYLDQLARVRELFKAMHPYHLIDRQKPLPLQFYFNLSRNLEYTSSRSMFNHMYYKDISILPKKKVHHLQK